MKAALPKKKGAFLTSPGPTVISDLTKEGKVAGYKLFEGRPISIMIGKILHFTQLIILDVDCDFKSIMSVDNKPMSVDCNVTFKTIRSYTAEDIEKVFIK
jgi:hypothetical protein